MRMGSFFSLWQRDGKIDIVCYSLGLKPKNELEGSMLRRCLEKTKNSVTQRRRLDNVNDAFASAHSTQEARGSL